MKLINSETIKLYWEIGEEIYRKQLGKVNCAGIIDRITKRILGGERLFSCQFVENAQFLFDLS